MKYCIIIPDGMADYKLEELGGKTPLEAAETPNFDSIAFEGLSGLVDTVPETFSPGSDIACLSVMGYDPEKFYTGRAPIEAASLGIHLRKHDWAVRCNLITRNDTILEDFCADHISSKEASFIISTLNEKMGTDEIHFYAGNSYRNIMTYSGNLTLEAECTPPHDIIGKAISSHLPKGAGGDFFIELMMKSHEILSDHQINSERIRLGKHPANMIWLWGQGQKPNLPHFKNVYNLSGAVITGVDLLKGLGLYLDLDIINVPGATGYIDTDYDAKATYAIEAFHTYDLVLIHIEAPDEAGHAGNLSEKIRAIENIDKKIVGPVYNALKKHNEFRMLILPDHYTPVQKKTHTREPVPFIMYGTDSHIKSKRSFSESNSALSNIRIRNGYTLMRHFVDGDLFSV